MTHLQKIAAFVADREGHPIPAKAIERAKLALVDFVGVAIAGSVEPVSKIVRDYVGRTSHGSATVIGAPARASAADAALANATTGHALDFDDSNFVLGGHPTVTMLAALLAVGQERRSSGREILEAYVVGFDVMMKISRAVNFEHYEKGWHPTATMGTFGTAAAVARLMRLPADVVEHALGLAASMASGVKANFGSMTKPFQVGHASQKGVVCAELAASGLTASANALEGRQGFLEVYNGAGNYRADALSDFGERYEILDSGIMFKQYPCCGATHAPIDTARDLVRGAPLYAEDIESVTVRMNKRRVTHVDRPVVKTGLEGKFSIQYTIAAALTDGAVGLRHFSDAALARPDLQDLVRRVKAVGVEGGDALGQACEIEVALKGGGTRSARREDAADRETDAYPRYMAAKFADCVEQVFDRAYADALLPQLTGFDACVNVDAIMSKLAGAGR